MELHRSSTQYFDLRKMLKELQKKAKPKINTNLDEAKRLAAIEKKQKEAKQLMMDKVKTNLLEKVKTKMTQQQSETESNLDASVVISTPMRNKSDICAESPTLQQSFTLDLNPD